jgi:hypothetical protein
MMASFDFTGERVSIVDGYNQRVDLTQREALHLLHWLSNRRYTLLGLTSHSAHRVQSGEKRLELRLYQHDLEDLDTLRRVIPGLREPASALKVLVAQLDPVTERAIELLKELRFEYEMHPLLEDNDAFAQG